MADNDRREFLKKSIALTGGLFATTAALADMCTPTPPQTEGPFYPLSKITDDSINDLTLIDGHARAAKGETIYIVGKVLDESCNPVQGALVEIWQAAASGRYNHPSDSSGLEVDPDFQNWGEFVTEADGSYVFKTIIPGHYPADENWTRPPHVHYKVTRRGFHQTTSQMYFTPSSFEGDKALLVQRLNAADLILKAVPNPESVIVEFAPAQTSVALGNLLAYRNGQLARVGTLTARAGERVGKFDVTLRKVR